MDSSDWCPSLFVAIPNVPHISRSSAVVWKYKRMCHRDWVSNWLATVTWSLVQRHPNEGVEKMRLQAEFKSVARQRGRATWKVKMPSEVVSNHTNKLQPDSRDRRPRNRMLHYWSWRQQGGIALGKTQYRIDGCMAALYVDLVDWLPSYASAGPAYYFAQHHLRMVAVLMSSNSSPEALKSWSLISGCGAGRCKDTWGLGKSWHLSNWHFVNHKKNINFLWVHKKSI